jgi:hypothetical protein
MLLPEDFSSSQRKQILERDGYKCVICGKGEKEGMDLSGFVPVGGKTKDGKALLKRTREHMVDAIEKMNIK